MARRLVHRNVDRRRSGGGGQEAPTELVLQELEEAIGQSKQRVDQRCSPTHTEHRCLGRRRQGETAKRLAVEKFEKVEKFVREIDVK